jgi:SAM-dependent methyltransferase
MMADVHRVASDGFSNSAPTYARGRPEYPEELLAWLQRDIGLGPTTTVIDLGAGTGKFTRLLVRTGANVVAVEPVDAMRAELAVGMPGVHAIAGTAQAMNLPDGSSDAVVCAQAFHWFADERAIVEIHRVLKREGRLGLVWNVRDESVDWVAAITDIIKPYEGNSPRYYKGDWRRPFAGGLFSGLEESCYSYVHVGAPQRVIVDRFLSVSFIAALPNDEKLEVAGRLSKLIASHPQLKGRESIAFPYQTHAYRCTRI